MTRSVVSIVRCPDYTYPGVVAAVAEAIDLADARGVLRVPRILLKPNLLSTRSPDEAVTTHPCVVRAVGLAAKEAGAQLALGDSPPFAGESPTRYARLCEMTGMTSVAADLGAELVRFEEDVVSVSSPEGRFYRSFELARAAVESDLVISISKLKTHGLTLFSGAVKNTFGCVPGIRKGLFHVQAAEESETFAQMLLDLLGALKPGVHVMDAVIGMEGEGPNSGSPRPIGVILASIDPVALDAVACGVVGIDPMRVDTTRLAHEQGLGCGDVASIEVRGASIEEVRVSGFRLSSGRNDWARIPAPVRRMLRCQLVAAPRISSRECIGCGDCVRVCPVQAITSGKPPTIDLSACIRCYCCHEVCNMAAIGLRRGWLGSLAFRLQKKR